MNIIFYDIVKILLKIIVYIFIHPKVKGKEFIPKEGSIVLAGNHTKWLDPITLIAVVPRRIHFLAKIELFKGIVGKVVSWMGSIPVNRKIHHNGSLEEAIKVLEKQEVIGIFPEGTISKGKLLPFKYGAVNMASSTDSYIIPFVIKGKYRILGKSVEIEFLDKYKISKDLEKENEILRNKILNKLEAKNEK